MGSIGETYALYVSQFSGHCDGGEFDFPFGDVCHQEDFFKCLVWGEGNYQQFKYSWFVKPTSGYKVSKGLCSLFILKLCFLNTFFR